MTNTTNEEVADFLKHAGILGQKWGRRLYQNPDGTYTELGKIRKRQSRKDSYSSDYVRSRSKRNVKEMSNEELRFATERRKLETNYKQAKKPSYDSSALSTGQKFVAGFAGLTASAVAISKAYKPLIKPAVNKILDSVGKTIVKKGTVIL